MNNSHSVDKHVGKDDEQLAQRLRDQSTSSPTQDWPLGKPKIGAASTFEDMSSAQRLTQHCLDENSGVIKSWLEGPPPASDGDPPKDFTSSTPDGSESGRSISKQEFKNHGMNAQSHPVDNVKTVLKYDSNLDPPFVVLTSMPAD